jgi:hypothetical protein
MSTLTWLDFSDAERRRALQVVELLGRPETRDELGLAAIRDAFANALFPRKPGGHFGRIEKKHTGRA